MRFRHDAGMIALQSGKTVLLVGIVIPSNEGIQREGQSVWCLWILVFTRMTHIKSVIDIIDYYRDDKMYA